MSARDASVISMRSVSKTYEADGQPAVGAVDGVSLDIPAGEFAVITGRSGSGKTTLLNLAAGLARPSTGEVLLDGEDLWGMSDARRSRLRNGKIGFVFQFPSLMPSLTVLENVLLPTALASNHKETDWRDRAFGLLDVVGLSDKVGSYPRQLSAGQQQRVVFARALINRPRIILADEPSSNLDEHTEREVMELFRKVHTSTGVTILMVTHASGLVSAGTRSIAMAAGRVSGDAQVGAASSAEETGEGSSGSA